VAVAWRNPPWQRDELILAPDLYFRHRPDTISKQHPDVAVLSELLNALPIHFATQWVLGKGSERSSG
jgi:5-methylcytosine-specific restriction protein A